jgi:hypothetical protein
MDGIYRRVWESGFFANGLFVFTVANIFIPWFIARRFPEPVRSLLWNQDRQYLFFLFVGRVLLVAVAFAAIPLVGLLI